jgi:hypothetical protein
MPAVPPVFRNIYDDLMFPRKHGCAALLQNPRIPDEELDRITLIYLMLN